MGVSGECDMSQVGHRPVDVDVPPAQIDADSECCKANHDSPRLENDILSQASSSNHASSATSQPWISGRTQCLRFETITDRESRVRLPSISSMAQLSLQHVVQHVRTCAAGSFGHEDSDRFGRSGCRGAGRRQAKPPGRGAHSHEPQLRGNAGGVQCSAAVCAAVRLCGVGGASGVIIPSRHDVDEAAHGSSPGVAATARLLAPPPAAMHVHPPRQPLSTPLPAMHLTPCI